MSLTTLLFNPNGRAGARTFLRGIVVLLAVMIVINVASVYGGPALGAIMSILTLAMPYFYLCVFGKRLHDRGMSAWFYLLFFLGYVALDAALQAMLMPVLSPAATALREEMTMLMEQGQWTDALSYAPEIARLGQLTSLVSLMIANGVLGLIAARLKSDPQTNAYGPPTGDAPTLL